ncbi:MAG: TerB family tellurite resistance protein, partial [Planctomycetaceae bacterium]|nr:TerB family tellurite resistance protein [Planctomycetaceae bacterium]
MPDPAARRKFEALVAAAFADGYLAESEKTVLERKAARMGISHREMHEIIALGQQRKLSIGIPQSAPERESLLEHLIEVVAADGRVEAPE